MSESSLFLSVQEGKVRELNSCAAGSVQICTSFSGRETEIYCFPVCTVSCLLLSCLHSIVPIAFLSAQHRAYWFPVCTVVPIAFLSAQYRAYCFPVCTVSCLLVSCLHSIVPIGFLSAQYRAYWFPVCTVSCLLLSCLHSIMPIAFMSAQLSCLLIFRANKTEGDCFSFTASLCYFTCAYRIKL
jgi:hypothetical protein